MSTKLKEPLSHNFGAEDLIRKTITVLAEHSGEYFEDYAQRLHDRLRSGELVLKPKEILTLTAFELEPRFTGHGEEAHPVITYDPNIISARPEVVRAELVRTMFIADHFPLRFKGRLRGIYEGALDVQSAWLNSEGLLVGPLRYKDDPRLIDHEQLLKKLMGKAGFYLDTSFWDWKRAIDKRLTRPQHPSQTVYLEKLRVSPVTFIIARAVHAGTVYSSVRRNLSSSYFDNLDFETRASISAANFVAIKLRHFAAQLKSP